MIIIGASPRSRSHTCRPRSSRLPSSRVTLPSISPAPSTTTKSTSRRCRIRP
ncbi:hypothetical protein [Kutzneria sp. NPDC052558]|uniref:hypothetical protein n=1 Tax=Kutzneria sp. NPDC052558 TaxID=3364121 RepID=UPI0037C71713